MKFIIGDAPEGVVATWYFIDEDTLVIKLGKDLDDVTRKRWIAQAKSEQGIQAARRRLAIPFLLPAAGFHGASPARKATFVGAGVVAAAGIAAVAILPAALDSNTNSVQRNPSAAAPAPSPSHPSHPPHRHPPAPAPSKPPAGPGTPAEAPPTIPAVQHPRLPVHGVPASVAAPTHVPGVPTLPPKVPVPKPPPIAVHRPSPPLAVSVPAAGTRVSVSPRLSVRAHLGPLRLRLGQPQP